MYLGLGNVPELRYECLENGCVHIILQSEHRIRARCLDTKCEHSLILNSDLVVQRTSLHSELAGFYLQSVGARQHLDDHRSLNQLS